MLVRFLGLLIAIAAGVTATYFMWQPLPELSPGVLQLANDPVSGEHVTIRLMLTNPANYPILIAGAATSCNCTRVVTSGNRDLTNLQSPIQVPANGALPITAVVDTSSSSGQTRVVIQVGGLRNGKQFQLTSFVDMNVRRYWVADRPHVRISLSHPQTSPLTEVINIFDSLDDPGVEMDHLEVTGPGRVMAAIERVAPEEYLPGPEAGFTHRYRVTVTVDPANIDRYIEEAITIYPKNQEWNPIVIPVVVTKNETGLRATPEQILLASNSNSETQVRLVRVHIPSRSNLSVLANWSISPDISDVSATFRQLDDETLEITLKFDSAFPCDALSTLTLAYSGEEVLRLPIIAIQGY